MSKNTAIVAVIAVCMLVGAGVVLIVKSGGDSKPTPGPSAPADMREYNRKQIGDALDASRERGEEARRQSAQTQPSTAPSKK
jgi:hypothetical protein